MTTLVYRKPETSAAAINQPINGADYSTQFEVRNPAAVRKLARGIGGAVLLVALATPTGRGAALNIGSGVRNTVADLRTSTKYGDAGIITYISVPVKFAYETTPRLIAREIAGDGDIAKEIHLADLLAVYLIRANNLPDEDTGIKAGQTVTTLVSDLNGRSLGSLIDALGR